MSAASDRARFYLEQSVPELQELERKKIFSKEEISSIAKKRAEFEHKLNARGSQPSDFARYAEYEMNLDTLRRKRVMRLGVKANTHSGQRRIFFVLERATRKFHGDVGLWMQYIDYARKMKAHKKLLQILSAVLRLHPAKAGLWIYAAKYALDVQADMTAARSYLQRGLRFCKSSKELWLEYAKLEMIYISKIVGRRRILGLDVPCLNAAHATTAEATDPDMMSRSIITPEDNVSASGNNESMDQLAVQDLSSSPALNGAIPRAVFDAAMKQFPRDEALGRDFFDCFSEFDNVPCTSTLLQHVLDSLLATAPIGAYTLSCFFRQPVIGVEPTAPQFAAALRLSFGRLKTSLETTSSPALLAEIAVDWLIALLQLGDVDESIRKALSLMLQQTVHRLQELGSSHEHMGKLGRRLHDLGFLEEGRILLKEGPLE